MKPPTADPPRSHPPAVYRPSRVSRAGLLARRWGLALAVVGGLFAADVASKAWAELDLGRQGTRRLLRNSLVLRFHSNSGIAFGLWHGPRVYWKRDALIAYSSAVVLVLSLLLARRVADPAAGRLTTAGMMALLAGSAGNLRDRVMRGSVIDFIEVQGPRGVSTPAFNLADVTLVAGLGLCITGLLLELRDERPPPAAPADAANPGAAPPD